MPEVSEARPASTVVLLRDTPAGMETLLLKRNQALMFAGGFWVFPGGSIDEQELAACNGDMEAAARLTAAREAEEECGLKPRLNEMVQLSQWTTPEAEPRRFKTWFYAAPLHSDDKVVIDGGEIHDAMWIRVQDALDQHEAGELGILPPTYITLRSLLAFANVEALLKAAGNIRPLQVLPVFTLTNGEVAVLFRGDAGYEEGDSELPGARHRAELHGESWQYRYEGVDPDFQSLLNI